MADRWRLSHLSIPAVQFPIVRAKVDFRSEIMTVEPFAIICRTPPLLQFPLIRTILQPSRLVAEGRFAVVTTREAGRRWTLMWLLTSAMEADGEIVWSWRPKGLALKQATMRKRIAACDGGKRQGSPRRSRISRKPLRREGRLSPPVPVVFARLRKFLCARAPGAAATRSSLRPLTPGGSRLQQSSGEFSREDADSHLSLLAMTVWAV